MIRRLIILLLIVGCVFAKDIIAVLELEQKGLTKQEAEILTDRLITKLISIDKYQVVERTNMDKILKEQKFQHSGCTDSECAVEIGQLLNTDYIVIGSVSKFGSTYALDSRLIDVGQGTSLISAEFSMKGEIDVLLTTGMTSIAQQLCGLENTPQYLANQLEALEEEKRAAELKADVIRLQNLEKQLAEVRTRRDNLENIENNREIQQVSPLAQKIAIENSYEQKVSSAVSRMLGNKKFLVIVSIEFSTIDSASQNHGENDLEIGRVEVTIAIDATSITGYINKEINSLVKKIIPQIKDCGDCIKIEAMQFQ